ncbi:MAG: hypothetical protein JKY81_13640 [Colwellia sp.]|nr:hypothetical protein [Colwellia sp.]
MTIEQQTDLVKEWQTLHNSHEHYEYFALLIKLVAVTLTVLGITFYQLNLTFLLVLAVLWLQEGIWKTYQIRVSNRIELLEQALIDLKHSNENTTIPFQFYRQWHENRGDTVTLVKEYINNSLKPTVIYPYVPLMVIVLITNFYL